MTLRERRAWIRLAVAVAAYAAYLAVVLGNAGGRPLAQAGYAAARGAETTVVLDTTLTPELIREGIARDFVRGVQDAHKRAGGHRSVRAPFGS